MEKEYVTLNSGSKTAARSSKNTKSRRKTGHSKSNIRRSALETKRTGSSRTGMRKVNGSSKSTSPRTSRSKKKSRSRKMDIPVQYIAGGAVLVILLIAIIFAVRSCGTATKHRKELSKPWSNPTRAAMKIRLRNAMEWPRQMTIFRQR